MEPIYTPNDVNPAYQLNWGLTIFWRQQPIPDSEWLTQLQTATEPDGVRILKHRTLRDGATQFFISTRPQVSPSQLIRSVKGRLQYLIGSQQPKVFQRNYAVRSIGTATRSVVESTLRSKRITIGWRTREFRICCNGIREHFLTLT